MFTFILIYAPLQIWDPSQTLRSVSNLSTPSWVGYLTGVLKFETHAWPGFSNLRPSLTGVLKFETHAWPGYSNLRPTLTGVLKFETQLDWGPQIDLPCLTKVHKFETHFDRGTQIWDPCLRLGYTLSPAESPPPNLLWQPMGSFLTSIYYSTSHCHAVYEALEARGRALSKNFHLEVESARTGSFKVCNLANWPRSSRHLLSRRHTNCYTFSGWLWHTLLTCIATEERFIRYFMLSRLYLIGPHALNYHQDLTNVSCLGLVLCLLSWTQVGYHMPPL
jgi:hypothetical protein